MSQTNFVSFFKKLFGGSGESSAGGSFVRCPNCRAKCNSVCFMCNECGTHLHPELECPRCHRSCRTSEWCSWCELSFADAERLSKEKKATQRSFAELPIDRCQVRGCLYEGLYELDGSVENRKSDGSHRSNPFLVIHLCLDHYQQVGRIYKRACVELDLITPEELEAQTPNPHPFTASELENFRFSGITLPYEKVKCPHCGGELRAKKFELIKDLLGQVTTIIDGTSVKGVVVCCASCMAFWQIKARERVRKKKEYSPLGKITTESLRMTPKYHVEEFPFGCPECNDGKPVSVKVPDTFLDFTGSPVLQIRYKCPNGHVEQQISSQKVGSSFVWYKSYRDGSGSGWEISDCKKCGAKRSYYEDRNYSSSDSARELLQGGACRACGVRGA